MQDGEMGAAQRRRGIFIRLPHAETAVKLSPSPLSDDPSFVPGKLPFV